MTANQNTSTIIRVNGQFDYPNWVAAFEDTAFDVRSRRIVQNDEGHFVIEVETARTGERKIWFEAEMCESAEAVAKLAMEHRGDDYIVEEVTLSTVIVVSDLTAGQQIEINTYAGWDEACKATGSATQADLLANEDYVVQEVAVEGSWGPESVAYIAQRDSDGECCAYRTMEDFESALGADESADDYTIKAVTIPYEYLQTYQQESGLRYIVRGWA